MPLLRLALATTLGFFFLVLGAGDARAYVLKRTPEGDLLRWHASKISFTVDPALEAAIPGATAAIRRALARWSDVADAPAMELVSDASPSGPLFDRKNGIFYSKDASLEPEGTELAKTIVKFDEGTGEIVDADIVISEKYVLRVLHDDGASEVGAAYDFEHVIAHELGHSLGLKDERSQTTALMYYETPLNDASVRAPSADDVSGITELYTSPLGGTSSQGCATTNGRRPGSSGAIAAGVLLLWWLSRRARKPAGEW